MNSNSRLVVLEGIDKAGKTTQAHLLEHELLKKELDPVIMTFPNKENVTGKMIGELLQNRRDYKYQFFHILMSANRWEDVKIIEGHLSDGRIVIMNRYFQSNLVYGTANKLDPDWLRSLDKGLPEPNLVIVIEIDPGVSFKRGVARDNFEVNIDLMRKTARLYKEYGQPIGWKFVNGMRKKEDVAKEILGYVEEIL